VQFPHSNFIIGNSRNFRSEFAPYSIEEDKLIPGLHAQDVARVVGLGTAQR
jgi:hypothetical protein